MSYKRFFALIFCIPAIALIEPAAPANANSLTVTFTGTYTAGTSCTSVPNLITASANTTDTLTLANMTGTTTTVYVNGWESPYTLAPNTAGPMFAMAGVWTITLVPDCLPAQPTVTALTITVTAPVGTPSPSGSPSPTPSVAPSAALSPSPTAITNPQVSPSAAPSPSVTATPTKTRKPHPAHTANPVLAPTVSPGGDPSPSASTGPTPSGIKFGPTYALAGSNQSTPAAPSYPLTVLALVCIITVGTASIRALARKHAGEISASTVHRHRMTAATVVLPRV